MESIRSFTSLEQSRKLAEILQLESADMSYMSYDNHITLCPYNKMINDGFDKDEVIPCWSLAALIDVIPKEVKIKGQRYAPCLLPIIDGHWLYKLWHNSNEIIESPIGVYCDNPIDACYEMILKLNKMNLL